MLPMIRMLHIPAALGAILCLAACGAADTSSDKGATTADVQTGPAYWTLSDEDTTIHLFGTVHTLKPEMRWKTDDFVRDFGTIDALFLEADLETPSVLNRLQTTVSQQAVFTDGTVLDDYLEDDEEVLVDQAASLVGLAPDELQNLRPWLLSQSLTELYATKQGYDDDYGVEAVLLKDARQRNIEVRYLESAEVIIRRLGALEDAETADMLVATARDIMKRPGQLDELVGMWASADTQGLADAFDRETAFGSDEVYDLLLADRNQDWAAQIDQLMNSSAGTFMIAVGAGHLVGPDRVQTLLTERGYTVRPN